MQYRDGKGSAEGEAVHEDRGVVGGIPVLVLSTKSLVTGVDSIAVGGAY